MAWPLSQDYNEAIQSPGRSFADPDLRGGEVVVNALGLPMPCSGNFADVYQVRGPDGARWAVKCFTREVPGLRERYREISRHLRQAKLPFSVDFSYLEQGIRVVGRWFPVLKMEWVEGLTLSQFVARYADRPAMLEALLPIWTRMGQYLRAAQIAHCDLQHGNVLLVPGASANSVALKLIDYDGMWVPALADNRSGEVGHPSFQHPQRLRDQTYSLDVDRFPLLLVAAALRAVTVKGQPLWEKYDNGDNLLFKEADLLAPTKSFLFLDLIRSADPLTVALADHLLKALRGGLTAAPLLEEVLPEAPPAPGPARRPAAAVVAARPGPVIRRTRRKTGGARVAAVVAAVAVLLAGLGALAAALSRVKPEDPGHAPPAHAVAQTRPEPEPEPDPVIPRRVPLRPRATEPIKEEKPLVKPAGDKPPPKESTEPMKPAVGDKPPAKEITEPKPAPAAEKKKFTNSVGMTLVAIQPGKFLMGASPEEAEHRGELPETPRHEVRITKGFCMGIYEVTQGQYEKVMGTNPSRNTASPDHPVERVDWDRAVEFCKKLSQLPDEKQAGRTYRLPTEAEWEYACRAGTTTFFYCGDSLSFKQANKAPESTGSVKVGSYPPNAWGLYDMHGNVWEWCQDGPREYTAAPTDDPRGPETDDGNRVLRGGGWLSLACRSALRKARARDFYSQDCGFRVVCDR